METSKSKFTIEVNGKDVSLYKVLGNAERDILSEMKRLARDDHPRPRLPGPNPVSIERKDFRKMKKSTYVIAEKTDGIRFFFFCLRVYDLKICTIIDRAFNVYLLSLQHIPRALFQGTLFDGELTIDTTGTPKFVLFDAVIVSGVTVSHLSLSDRLVAMMRSLQEYKRNSVDPVVLDVKRWISLGDPNVRSRLAAAESRYSCDGYVMMHVTKPVVYGRDFDMYKLKPSNQHTVDFIVLDASGTIGVYDPKIKKNVPMAKIEMVERLFLIGTVVECAFENGRWTAIHARFDKNQANDMLTYKNTLKNIVENLTLDDILNDVPV